MAKLDSLGWHGSWPSISRDLASLIVESTSKKVT